MAEDVKVFNEELVSMQGDKTEQNNKVTKEESVSKKGNKMEEKKKFVNEDVEFSYEDSFDGFKYFFKGLILFLYMVLSSRITTNILLGLIAWCILDKYLY